MTSKSPFEQFRRLDEAYRFSLTICSVESWREQDQIRIVLDASPAFCWAKWDNALQSVVDGHLASDPVAVAEGMDQIAQMHATARVYLNFDDHEKFQYFGDGKKLLPKYQKRLSLAEVLPDRSKPNRATAQKWMRDQLQNGKQIPTYKQAPRRHQSNTTSSSWGRWRSEVVKEWENSKENRKS